jgi:hypothetical protein
MIATKTKVEIAREIARFHFDVDEDLRRVFLLGPVREEDPDEPIKLLEVEEDAVESWIMPVSFPSNNDMSGPYPFMIVQLSPREFERIDPANIPFRGETWTIVEELPR